MTKPTPEEKCRKDGDEVCYCYSCLKERNPLLRGKPSEARVDWELAEKLKEILYKTRWAGEFNDLIWYGTDNNFLRDNTFPQIMSLLSAAFEKGREAR